MSRTTRLVSGSAAVLMLSGIAFSVLAQTARTPADQPMDVSQAKAIAALIKNGQMSLQDATQLAERHTKGVALEAECAIRPVEPEMRTPGVPGGASGEQEKRDQEPRDQSQARGDQRLVHIICCYADNKVVKVQIDGLTKKVINEQPKGDQIEQHERKMPQPNKESSTR